MRICNTTIVIFIFLIHLSCQPSQKQVLGKKHFKHYIDKFNRQDDELYKQHIANDSSFEFLAENIPLIEIPDKTIEETYYFRWWTYRKHIKQTTDGFVITEFLPDVPWAKKHNTINCPAGHHIYEGRWLRNPLYIEDYINFWLYKSGDGIRQYSFWVADASMAFYQVHPNDRLLIRKLPDFVNNYEQWELERRDDNRILFWQYDNNDGMEVSVSGRILNDGNPGSKPGIRPTINSYMFGDAMAIAQLAEMSDNKELANKYHKKAMSIKNAVQKRLWNEQLQFFTVLPKDFGPSSQPVDVREILGYVPWYFNLPKDDSNYAQAWRKINDTTGFKAPYGLTVCERSHALFEVSYEGHECQWNGPSWPFATSQTLKALSQLLNNYDHRASLEKDDFYQLLHQFAKSQSRVKENGEKLNWIDENINPFTGDWISRTRLKTWDNGNWSAHKGGKERGKDYNHSSFCDLVIADLIGFKPQMDDVIELNPLVPDHWEWFCLDRVIYHQKEITIIWDKTGNKYNMGIGLMVLVDGELKAQINDLEPLKVKI